MTKQKLLELSTKIGVFMQAELKNESVYGVAAATIFVLSYYASMSNENIILPETLCTKGLINLDNVKKESIK